MANKILLAGIIFLSGCFGRTEVYKVRHDTKDAKETKTYPFVPTVYDKWTLGDPKLYSAGMWTLYKVKEKGTAYDFKIAVVGQEGSNLRVEITRQEQIGNVASVKVSLQLVAPDGKVISALYKEGDGPAVEQTIEPQPQEVVAEWPKIEKKITAKQKAKCQAGNFTADLHSYIITQEDGSQTATKKYISKDVPPLYEGGLVLSEETDKSFELVSFGIIAK